MHCHRNPEKGTLTREDVVQARIVKEANLQLEASEAAPDDLGRRLKAMERV